MKLSNELYNALKWLALIGLPAIATLYFALAAIWGLPYADKVDGSIIAVDTALGAMLRISSAQFSKSNTLAILKRPEAEPVPPSE
jgi:hypothetical protein